MISVNSRIRFGFQIVFVCFYITPSQYHHCAKFIWRHNLPVRYNLSSLWVRLSTFAQLSIIQYGGGGGGGQFTHSLCDDWENININFFSYYHHQIGSMNYYPLFSVRSWNNGMRLAGANGVAAGSSLARPRHRWWKVPIQIGWENFHRWRHYLKLVTTL